MKNMRIEVQNSKDTDLEGAIAELLQKDNAEKGHSSTALYYTISVFEEDKLIGSANVILKWSWAFIEDLYVNKEIRGKGIGRKIVTQIEGLAKEHKKIGVYLFTVAFQVPEFYEKLGFKETGRVPKLVNGHDEILMCKEFQKP